MENDTKKEKYDVAVIGGGAAGMMAAISVSRNGAKVVLIEKNSTLGKKLLLTGHGRCNLTHWHDSAREFIEKLGKKEKFLYSSLSAFGPQETIVFFNSLGLKTKIEKDGRVFPESDDSYDVLSALQRELKKNKVEILFNQNVAGLKTNGEKIEYIKTTSGKIYASNFILAIGGKSFPATGSSGDSYEWLSAIGHTISPPHPALVPIKTKEHWTQNLQGISLENVGIAIVANNKKISSYSGQIIFTHFGLSGPAIINASAEIARNISGKNIELEIDIFPNLSILELEEKMKKDFTASPKKSLKNYLAGLFPERLAREILFIANIEQSKKIADVSRSERANFARLMKGLSVTVSGTLCFDQAMITAGGVNLKEVDPKTMRSKIWKNLSFAGEILDLDGPTGGYNLQIAWTTGYTAGINV